VPQRKSPYHARRAEPIAAAVGVTNSSANPSGSDARQSINAVIFNENRVFSTFTADCSQVADSIANAWSPTPSSKPRGG
jgi:flagellar biosynthesis regulator FlaF